MKRGRQKKQEGAMGVLRTAVTILVVSAVVVAGGLAYIGVFSGIRVAEKEIGPYTYVFEPFVGDYAKTGPVFEKMRKSLLAEGADASMSIGIYYDDPQKTAKDELRSDCGIIVREEDLARLPKLMEKYTGRTLAGRTRPVVEFPYRNRFSFLIGAMKAYPELTKYVQQRGYKTGAAIEVYDTRAGKILYCMDIEGPSGETVYIKGLE